MSESAYTIDGWNAAEIVQTLYCVADMIEQPPESPVYLTEDHLRVMTSPPSVIGFYTERARSANRLRRTARILEQQLPEDAPDTERPHYPLHQTHPPFIDWNA